MPVCGMPDVFQNLVSTHAWKIQIKLHEAGEFQLAKYKVCWCAVSLDIEWGWPVDSNLHEFDSDVLYPGDWIALGCLPTVAVSH